MDFSLHDLDMVGDAAREARESELDFSAIDVDLERFSQNPVIRDALGRGVDLRQYSKQVDAELRSMEALSIADYIRESDSIAGLFTNISQCEADLTDMQKMLQSFQDSLGGISNEIKSLQEDSLKLGIKMQNRKDLGLMLAAMRSKFFVSQPFLARIRDNPIDETWLRDLRALAEKVEYCSGAYRSAASRAALATQAPGLPKPNLPPDDVKETTALEALGGLSVNPMTTMAGKEALPEIVKLQRVAVDRITAFLKTNIDAVAKPEKTNIQEQQKHLLVRFAYAVAFLQEHGGKEAKEVRDYYASTFGACYAFIFKKYAEEISKLVAPGPGRGETLGSFEAAASSSSSTSAAAAAAAAGASSVRLADPFNLLVGARDRLVALEPSATSLLHLDTEPLKMINAGGGGGGGGGGDKRMSYESSFRHLSRHLINVAESEEFVLKRLYGADRERKEDLGREAKEVLAGALRGGIAAVLEAVEAHAAGSWDALGLLLTLAITALHKRGSMARGFRGTCAYSDRVALLVWPRWKVVFEGHLQSLRALNNSAAKAGGGGGGSGGSGGSGAPAGSAARAPLPPADAAAIHPLTARYAHFKASVIFLHRNALMGAGPPIEDETIPKQVCVARFPFFVLLPCVPMALLPPLFFVFPPPLFATAHTRAQSNTPHLSTPPFAPGTCPPPPPIPIPLCAAQGPAGARGGGAVGSPGE
jgi:hypothetical protein